MIAMPTTAGTGSEAGRGTLIQLPQTGRKTIALSPHLLPSTAICDPELTRDLPPALTAATGMDAFTHCVESYPLDDVPSDLRWDRGGRPAVRFPRDWRRPCRDGSNAEARTAMMMGALLGGISFHKGLGVVHSLSHALGCRGSRPSRHAECDPASACACDSTARRPARGWPTWRGDWGWAAAATRRAPDHLDRAGPGSHAASPTPGAARGLSRDRIAEYARLAMLDHCHRTNPRPCTQADMEDLLDRAW